MKKIKLSQGKYAMVDDEDFENVSKCKWYFHAIRGYAYNPNLNPRYMHRFILGLKNNKDYQNEMVDHINGDPLDNRKSNLRICDKIKNQHNRKNSSANKTGYKGVSFFQIKKKYQARITINKKKTFLGYFDCPHEAAKAYNDAAINYFGEFALINKIKKGGEL